MPSICPRAVCIVLASALAGFPAGAADVEAVADPVAADNDSDDVDASAAVAPVADAAAPAAAEDAAAAATRSQVGVGLLAIGTAVAAGSTVAYTLVEALTTPDRDTGTVSATQETLSSIGGFASVAAVSVSAVVIVIGAGLAISGSGAPIQ
jgi:hypothetical protein